MTITKEQINKLFSVLRQKKLMAKQDLACCQTCALFEIEQEYNAAKENHTKAANKIGYVFYHRQDAEFAFGEPVKTAGGSKMPTTLKNDLYLSFGGFGSGFNFTEDQNVAKIICETIKECGLVYSWNGSSNKRIIVRNRKRK